MRAVAARLGLGLGDPRVGADDRAVRPRRGADRDPDVAAVGVRDAELLVDAALGALDAVRRGAARAGSSRRRGRAARDGSDGAPISASTGTPSIRAIASLALRTTPCGSQTMMPSSRARAARARAPRRRPSPAGAHPVPDAADRADEVRRAGVIGELAAQVGDVDVDEVVVAEPVLAPDALEQLGAAERDARLRR